jgi:hypothetical protein
MPGNTPAGGRDHFQRLTHATRPNPTAAPLHRRTLGLLTAALGLAAATGLHAQSAGPQTALPYLSPSSPPSTPPDPAQFGAIAFTADGSFASAWKYASKSKVEARTLSNCSKFGRGKCEVVSFREELCAALVSGKNAAGRWITMTGGGLTPPDARRSAIERCNKDSRTRGPCELRTVICGDGRSVPVEPAPSP